MKRLRLLLAGLAFASSAAAATPPLPLPPAPVRLVIPDAEAFDAALSGRWRLALDGEADADDPLVGAWRRTGVGAKLEDQWSRLAKDMPWSWAQIRALQPRRVGVALLEVGHLEAVLVIDTPLAALPLALPAGEAGDHAGVPYRLVARGAADGGSDERRMGLAWARLSSLLVLATSERALRRAIDTSLSGEGFDAPLGGLASLELDLDALRKDLYFRREFLFGSGPETGRLRAALRMEDGHLVELREGPSDEPAAAFRIETAGLGAGWEPTASGLFASLRASLLEPEPGLSERPLSPQRPLPPAGRDAEDRYLVDLRQALPGAGPENEEAELRDGRELLERHAPSGWGWSASSDGGARIVFEWPAERDAELLAFVRRTVERRAGRVSVVAREGAAELRVGPDLAALGLRRTGRFVWFGPDAAALAGATEPLAAPGVVRWARLDLDALRSEAVRWPRVEGPANPEQVRPFSDRLLGLLGWVPDAHAIAVERHSDGHGSFSERVVFE
jgi:hypothetical protein